MSDTRQTSGARTPRNLFKQQLESAKQQKPVERRYADDFSQQMGKRSESPANTAAEGISQTEQNKQKAEPVPDQVFMVNNLVNKNFRYVRDSRQFNSADYWQTPAEMKKNMAGDCEDFAIIKYQILEERGVSEDKLSLAYGKLNGEAHLITLYTDNNGHEHVLDNASSQINTVDERDDLHVLVRFKMSDVSFGDDGWLKVLEKLRSASN